MVCLTLLLSLTLHYHSYMQYHIDHCDPTQGETYRLAKEFGQQLLDNCREALQENPLYKDGELSVSRNAGVERSLTEALYSDFPHGPLDIDLRQGRYHLRRGCSRECPQARTIRAR